jgi:anaerobic carbon-monoxide dehydrogenase catalytic subunit
MTKGIDYEIADIMHRIHYSAGADPTNLIWAGLRCAMADMAGSYIGTDILFGTPQPVITEANLYER